MWLPPWMPCKELASPYSVAVCDAASLAVFFLGLLYLAELGRLSTATRVAAIVAGDRPVNTAPPKP